MATVLGLRVDDSLASQTMHRLSLCCRILSCALLCFTILGVATPSQADSDLSELFLQQRFIVHALGEWQGRVYGNSRESFILHYLAGHRFFEVDLVLTSDTHLVARHSWKKESFAMLEQVLPEQTLSQRLSVKQFLETPIFGTLTPLDIDGLLELLREFPEAYIITDTKRSSRRRIHAAFTQIAARANELGVSDRVIPQIYSEEMLHQIREIAEFPNVIYTLYKETGADKEILETISRNEIRFVTVPRRRLSAHFVEALHARGAMAFTYTINDFATATRHFELGVDALYTDSLLPLYQPLYFLPLQRTLSSKTRRPR